MRIAHLILAHDNPVHLSRLVRTLSHGEDRCFIHVDAKAPLARFTSSQTDNSEMIASRFPVYWGDFSLVESIRALLSTAFQAKSEFDYFNLLSGADYPLQPAWHINDYIERRAGAEFISAVKIPNEPAGKPLSRIERYHRRPSTGLAGRAIFASKDALKLRPEKRPYKHVFGDLEPFGGSGWWALSRAAAEHVLSFFVDRPEVISFYENVRCPDESLFQTIVLNSPFGPNVTRNLTYTDWSQGGSHPAQLSEHHIAMFESQPRMLLKGVYGAGEALFARKLSDADGPLVDRLDRMIARRVHADGAGRDARALRTRTSPA